MPSNCPDRPDSEAIRRWLHTPAATAIPAAVRLPVDVFEDRLEAWEWRSGTIRRQPGLIAAAGYSSGGVGALGIMERRLPWARLLRGAPDEDADDLRPTGVTMQIRLAWPEALHAGGIAVVALAQRVTLW
jgi:hypothetical protein